jgi:hypothetical protein
VLLSVPVSWITVLLTVITNQINRMGTCMGAKHQTHREPSTQKAKSTRWNKLAPARSLDSCGGRQHDQTGLPMLVMLASNPACHTHEPLGIPLLE